MNSLFDTRRYLTNFDSRRTGNLFTDVLVIGSGVAGARAALEAAKSGSVILITKGKFNQAASFYAQGGIAASLHSSDSPAKHMEDTIRVGSSLNRREAVELLVTQGPDHIRELLDWGAKLDMVEDHLALTREGGHSVERIVHAHGDRTGEELTAVLKRRAEKESCIHIFENCFLIDMITVDGVCVGGITYHERHGHQVIWARQTILASGGCGRIWRETTNPPVSTGDGLAAAFRAGARLTNLELMQFHPTTLYVAGASRALISEAVRGEGAHLVDRSGNRFMTDYHPDAELAPRDIVSQSAHDFIEKTQASCVYLDVRHIKGFRERFPHISEMCAEFQIDVTKELIPVRPSAHYMIGGVDVDLQGSSSVPGLLCCGEAAWTGVHGANRLASNSLLEGLVFGKIAGQTATEKISGTNQAASIHPIENQQPESARTPLDLADIHGSLRSVMWRNVGIQRSRNRLEETCEIIGFWGHYTLDKTFNKPFGWEIQNQLTLAKLIASSAIHRAHSIGVHFRSDESPDGSSKMYDVIVQRNESGTDPYRRHPDRSE